MKEHPEGSNEPGPDAAGPAPFVDCVTAPVAEVALPVAEAPPAREPVAIPPVRDVRDLDWAAIGGRADPAAVRARMHRTVGAMEMLLDRAEGAGFLFDADRATAEDRAIQVGRRATAAPLWIIGDLHGDLLALETALAAIDAEAAGPDGPQLILLGDFFDDEGYGLEVLLRVFELILRSPGDVCVIAGNHDEALSYDGARFASSVEPADFAGFLNANLAHEWIGRAGKLAMRFFAQAPRALFFPDGLLVVHGGFPLVDLHPRLQETGDWNDPACLSDFVWTRCHPTARRKLPNRFSRGSQFGHQDFAAFCDLGARLGRPVTHMVRGHDHIEDRYAIHPAYALHPVLTTVALSRRLPRGAFGPRRRVPTLARYVEGALPQVHRMHIPDGLIDAMYPEPAGPAEPAEQEMQDAAEAPR
jgi:Calcineurin-like phosphoesterase